MIDSTQPRVAADVLGMEPGEVDRILAEGATLPAVFYTSDDVARLEDEVVFRRAWNMVGVEPELRTVGDYFTTHIAGTFFDVPVVVVRDNEMQLRAFINVCRHRAHFVAVGRGNRKTLQCTYHGWVYGLDGCLRGVPRQEEGGLPPFETLGLYPLPLETWRGYIFVAIEPTETLTEFIGELPQALDAMNFEYPFAPENADPEWEYVREVTRLQGGANWKAQEENNIECYHCATTHTNSFSKIFEIKTDVYSHLEFDRGVYHTSWYTDPIAAKLGQTEPSAEPDFKFAYLWPNLSFSGGPRSLVRASFARLQPDGVHSSYSEFVRYRMPGAETHGLSPELEAEFDEAMRITGEEDREAAARVQTGLRSGMYEYGYTMAESERNMRHFYKLVWDALAPSLR